MKTYKNFVALLATVLLFTTNAFSQQLSAVQDSVVLGPSPSYANEVYYRLATGEKASTPRTQWDIAFRTSILSASILTNDGAGVMLYTYPKADTNGWATFDTTGLTTWKALYNSLTEWENGAFNTYGDNQMDYGWGVYNITTHNLTGDSLYLLKTRSGQYLKLWIVGKASSLNKYTIRYANLDGSNANEKVIDCSGYTAKNFLGYSFVENKTVDFEPLAATQWDLLFTRYKGISSGTRYNVIGALINYKEAAATYHPVAPGFRAWEPSAMKPVRNAVGSDWKYFNGATYAMVDSMQFFVQDRDGGIYKLVFESFNWNTTGSIVFHKELISASGKPDHASNSLASAVYPNPATDRIHLVVNPLDNQLVTASLLSLDGNLLSKHIFPATANTLNSYDIEAANLARGMYLLKVEAGTRASVLKVVLH